MTIDSTEVPILLVMGVAGSGKTTIGRALADRLRWPFAEGDAFHPAENVAKMAAGVPLSDADRWPWLDAIAAWIAERVAEGRPAVVACSALKRAYRDRLRIPAPALRIIYLEERRDVLETRIAGRSEHFFPRTLLGSQLVDLEPPQADENAVVASSGESIDEVTAQVVEQLGIGAREP